MDLSHFQQSFPNKKKAIKKIGTVGDLLKKLIAGELKKLLMERDGPLLIISDLLMKWLRL